ncbi:hypothetical protein [Streptomyces sp. 6N223]|uniref:hypothetical protein n=1 Tax=Streptomyces sp. 6N223 TaxID=3457412 RepID=UPI003FD52559
MAAAAATLAPTTAGGEDDGRARVPIHARTHAQAQYAQAQTDTDREPEQRDPEQRPRPREAAREETSAYPAPGSRAATVRYSEPVVPVLPLGAGLTCLGVGIAIIGLRIRNG